ncbi:hypothetical protein D4764_12G0010920 [Takifugu flavidus]|uniref:Uncharacterized protein n=1 Tax=Takifugu flavidus TaxID=433684 RepID=A0A5C6PD37_9TELE|nr:hypothetical protein D4764_12G0010920 [Takifugu flavidus]
MGACQAGRCFRSTAGGAVPLSTLDWVVRGLCALVWSLRSVRVVFVAVPPVVTDRDLPRPGRPPKVASPSPQISEEYHRITSKDLLGTFNASLDKFVPGLLKLYRSKKGALGEKMEDLLDKLDEQVREVLLCLTFLEEYEYTSLIRETEKDTSDIVSHRKTAALRGLSIFLQEDATKVFLKCLANLVLQKVLPQVEELSSDIMPPVVGRSLEPHKQVSQVEGFGALTFEQQKELLVLQHQQAVEREARAKEYAF